MGFITCPMAVWHTLLNPMESTTTLDSVSPTPKNATFPTSLEHINNGKYILRLLMRLNSKHTRHFLSWVSPATQQTYSKVLFIYLAQTPARGLNQKSEHMATLQCADTIIFLSAFPGCFRVLNAFTVHKSTHMVYLTFTKCSASCLKSFNQLLTKNILDFFRQFGI